MRPTHELDLILWQQARREVAAHLLGLPVDHITRRNLLWANPSSATARVSMTTAAADTTEVAADDRLTAFLGPNVPETTGAS